MQIIKDINGNELACLYRLCDYAGSDSTFLTNNDDTLQVGILKFDKGQSAKAHIHKAKEIGTVYPVPEFIYVLYGTAKADIYDEDHKLVKTLNLKIGDILITKRGGHGYKFNEDTKLLDIRAGKYIDKEHDKEMI